jgi:ABC-type phosphate transport system substrate-binding protein
MKIILNLLILIIFLIIPVYSQVAVIANKSVPVEEINGTELLDFYSGDVRLWKDGNAVVVFDLKPKGDVKETFYEYLGKSISRMKSIWMKKLLSGEGDPPPALPSEEEMVKKVESTSGAIGFVSKEKVTDQVKILVEIQPKN